MAMCDGNHVCSAALLVKVRVVSFPMTGDAKSPKVVPTKLLPSDWLGLFALFGDWLLVFRDVVTARCDWLVELPGGGLYDRWS